MALKVILFGHHFVSLPYIYLFYGIYNYILLFPVSLVIIIIITIIIIIIIVRYLLILVSLAGAQATPRRPVFLLTV